MMTRELELEQQIHRDFDQAFFEAEKSPHALLKLAAVYSDSSADRWDIAVDYLDRIVKVCEKWSNGVNIAEGTKLLAQSLYYYYTTKFDKGLVTSEKAMNVLKANDRLDAYGVASMIRGAILRSLGEFDHAVNYLLIAEQNLQKEDIFSIYYGYCHYQLAEIYAQIRDYEAAEKSYLISAEGAEKVNRITPLFRSCNGLGNLYLAMGEHKKGFDYLNRSLEIAYNISQQGRALCDLGIYNITVGNYQEALGHLEKSYEIRLAAKFEDASSTTLMHMGKAHLELGDSSKAIECVEAALRITEKYHAKSKTVFCYRLIAEISERTGEWENAIHYYHKYQVLQDELSNQQMQNIYKLKNRLIQEQKTQIEEAHKEITDSIAYAKRIQTAILPSQRMLDTHLPKHFVLYLPKDVVAGDFYWLEARENTTYFAAADCTGHGVPGAMVSVVCHNALNRAVREYGETVPGKILDKTRDIVVAEFEKSEEDVKDGMDIALISLAHSVRADSESGDKENTHSHSILKFAGANNPLWLIRNGKLIEYIGDKQPVGKFTNGSQFNTHSISLLPGDTFYVLTDGFADQFGGPKGKKFKAKNLKDLILSIQDKPIEDQDTILLDAFNIWKGTLEQLDDVCIIGIRI